MIAPSGLPCWTASSISRLTVVVPMPRGGTLMIRISDGSSAGWASTFK